LLKCARTLILRSFYLADLLEPENLQKNIHSINREYEIMYFQSGDFDERLFIEHIDQIGERDKPSFLSFTQRYTKTDTALLQELLPKLVLPPTFTTKASSNLPQAIPTDR
jgi:hypothetical protein